MAMTHAMRKKQMRERTRIRDRERLARGLCRRCGKRRLATKYYCRKCADKAVEEHREYSQKSLQRGLCMRCGQRRGAGKRLCKKCQWIINEYNKARQRLALRLLVEYLRQHPGRGPKLGIFARRWNREHHRSVKSKVT